MTAAVALAVVLVIAVAGMSLAMQSQRPLPQARAPRPSTPRRTRDRKPTVVETPPPPPADPDPVPSPSAKGPELLRTGAPAEARVVSVVDERTVGPVTRSKLVLEITPEGGEKFETTIRMAFQTAAARARVKVGGSVPVHYDPDDHSRVVLDPVGDD